MRVACSCHFPIRKAARGIVDKTLLAWLHLLAPDSQSRAIGNREKPMIKMIRTIGDIAAVLGVAVCLVAGLARLAHTFSMGGVSTLTLFVLGIALMVFACLAKLHALNAAQSR